jgi:hypothetical protein
LHEQGLRAGADEPGSVEDLGARDADAVRADRRPRPQREVLADGQPVQVDVGVGVHEDEAP